MRDAAQVEAAVLAAELSGRMRTVTAQLSQRVESLMELPEPPKPPAVVAAARPTPAPRPAPVAPKVKAAIPSPTASAAAAAAAGAAAAAATAARPDAQPSASDLNRALGDLAELLNNIEVRGQRPRRPPGFTPDGRFGPPPGGAGIPAGTPTPAGAQPPPPGGRRGRPDVTGAGTTDTRPEGRPGGPQAGAGPPGGPAGGGVEEPVDPNRIRIDLRGVRRELFDELVPDRAAFDALAARGAPEGLRADRAAHAGRRAGDHSAPEGARVARPRSADAGRGTRAGDCAAEPSAACRATPTDRDGPGATAGINIRAWSATTCAEDPRDAARRPTHSPRSAGASGSARDASIACRCPGGDWPSASSAAARSSDR